MPCGLDEARRAAHLPARRAAGPGRGLGADARTASRGGHRVARGRGRPRRRPRTARRSPCRAGRRPGVRRPTAIDSEVMPMPTSAHASSGSAAASPQTPTDLPACLPASAVIAISCSTAGCHGVGEVGEVGGHPVGGHRVLGQVVGADREEVDDLEHPVGQQRRARDLDHHPGLEPALADLARRTPSPRRRWRPSAPSPRSRCRSSLGGQRDRVELALHQAGVVERRAAARGRRGRGSPRPSWLANASGLSEPASRVRTTT